MSQGQGQNWTTELRSELPIWQEYCDFLGWPLICLFCPFILSSFFWVFQQIPHSDPGRENPMQKSPSCSRNFCPDACFCKIASSSFVYSSSKHVLCSVQGDQLSHFPKTEGFPGRKDFCAKTGTVLGKQG